MRDIRFIDKTFDSTQSLLYHLSIQISLDGFSFCILDIPKGKYILLRNHPIFLKRPRLLLSRLRDVIEEEGLFNLEYKSIDIIYSTRKSTLVPDGMYSRGTTEKFFAFNHPLEKNFTIEKTHLHKAEAWSLYEIPVNLRDFLMSKFPKATLKHHIYPIIESSLKRNKSQADRIEGHLNFFRHDFDLIVIEGSQLKLYNNFTYRDENDVLYYVMYIFEHLKLNPEKANVIISGFVSRMAPQDHLLKKYVKKVSFAKLDTTYQYSYTFNEIPEHYYAPLLSLYRCE